MKVCVSVPLTLMTWACIVTLTSIFLFHMSHVCKPRANCLNYDLVCRCVYTQEVKWSWGVHGQRLTSTPEGRAPRIRCVVFSTLCSF